MTGVTDAVTDELFGAAPTCRLDDEPIYREALAELGIPGLDEPATAAPVIVGDVETD